MSKALSLDLRTRVLAIVAAGASHRAAAARFGVSAASVSRWRALERRQGDARPGPLGGDRRSARVEAQGPLIRELLNKTPDITTEELRAALAERAPPHRSRRECLGPEGSALFNTVIQRAPGIERSGEPSWAVPSTSPRLQGSIAPKRTLVG